MDLTHFFNFVVSLPFWLLVLLVCMGYIVGLASSRSTIHR